MFHFPSLRAAVGLGAAASLAACTLATYGIPDATPGFGASSAGGAGGAGGGASSTGGGASAIGGQSGQGGAGQCASADCETLPAGWTLVRARRIEPAEAADAGAPTCENQAAPGVYFYGPAAAACGPCTCGQPVGASCSAPQLTCSYSTLNCNGNDLQIQDNGDGQCSFHWPPLGPNSNGSCSLTAPAHLTNQGTCDAHGGGVTPAAPFAGTVVVCPESVSQGGCVAGRSCLPAAKSADGAVCITRGDDTPCPAGWTGDEIPAFEGAADTRACTACACDVACEGGYYVAWGNDTCGGNSVKVDTTSCVKAPNLFSWSMASVQSHVGTPKLAACNPPTPSGAVAAAGVHQICCK